MLRSVSFVVLLIGSFNVVCGRELSQDLITDETLAEQWLLELDPMMEKENNDVMTTQWNYNVNLTEENNRLQVGGIVVGMVIIDYYHFFIIVIIFIHSINLRLWQ